MSNYVLCNKIGEGGYSSVYRCKDQVGISYACKKILKSKVRKERVIREIEIMKSLAYCPTAIKLIEAGEDNDNYYIIQELCKRGSLSDYKKHEENEVKIIIRGVLRALHHIHKDGVLHCDIKPGNIFIFEDMEIKLGDFGSAMRLDTQDPNNTYLSGTPHFMAPETLNNVCNAKSDIWSLGVMLYYFISGRLPFNDKNNKNNPELLSVCKSIFMDEPLFVNDLWLNVSKSCTDFITQCLIKDHTKRPSILECLHHPWLLDDVDNIPLYKNNIVLSTL